MKLFLLALLGLAASRMACGQNPPGPARLQIVNATSFPTLSLRINGTEVYPEFPQGQQTADAALEIRQAVYQVSDRKTGASWQSERISYVPQSAQTLVILGDLSSDSTGHSPPPESGETLASKVLFLILPHTATASEKPVRLRVINGLARQTVSFSSADGETRTIPPGQIETLGDQPPVFTYPARAGQEKFSILMRQDENARNALIIFFLREGKPDFLRVFENP